jgi:2-polyprenyl-3-methyl-5-hydroxy-6-metoxy-1,4-benzoquinol methylase
VSELAYVREYFSQHARQWLHRAYGDGRHPRNYPVGVQRLRLTMEAVLERLGALHGRLVDLGCGGGELCAHAAGLGFDVTGVDIATGMIEEAEGRRRALSEAAQRRLRFRTGDALASGLPGGSADAVTALGLLEYLEGDDVFFTEAARLLRPGGVLVVSCRNRLFNLASLNDYTREEIEAGGAGALLAELRGFAPDGGARERLRELAARLREAADGLDEALAEDIAESGQPAPHPEVPPFARPRRQHTPHGLADAAARRGFEAPAFLAVHPHPLPPAFEAVAPRFYNRLATAWEPLERAPAGLGCSSAFLGVFSR